MIETSFAVTEEEFILAQLVACKTVVKGLPGRILILGVNVCFGVCIGLTFQYLPLWLVSALALTLLGLVITSRWRRKAIMKFQFRSDPDRLLESTFRLDVTGLREVKAGSSEVWLAWKSFTAWYETESLYVLGRKLSFMTLPKRALSPDQQSDIRSLLNDSLGSARTTR